MIAKPHNTAHIAPGLFCRACGWPIIHACCNDEMSREPWGTDWWAYCANKGCENHAGEDWGQRLPDIAFRDTVRENLTPRTDTKQQPAR